MTLAGPPAHLSQWELSLELLLPDSCWASSRIFSMSPLWMDSEAGTCSWLPADTELPLPLLLPLLLKCSSTQDPAGQRAELSPRASGLCYRATTLQGHRDTEPALPPSSQTARNAKSRQLSWEGSHGSEAAARYTVFLCAHTDLLFWDILNFYCST